MAKLTEYIAGHIWLREYPIHYAGCDFNARMAVVRLPGLQLMLHSPCEKLWWKAVFHMWSHPKPAPEYQLGWKDKSAARKSLQRILEWDFERIVIAHGDLIEADAKAAAREAWRVPLAAC